MRGESERGIRFPARGERTADSSPLARFGMTRSSQFSAMAYTVSKLTDYSTAALEKAAAECVRACADEASAARNDGELKTFRDRWVGRKNGILTQINDVWLKGSPKDAKREAGIRVNELKARIQELVEAARVD